MGERRPVLPAAAVWQQRRSPGRAVELWRATRPVVYRVLESGPLVRFAGFRSRAWYAWWSLGIRLRYWSWYPAANPKLFGALVRLVVVVAIAASAARR